jgi:hypothetical protein
MNIAAAGNVEVPAYLVIIAKGYDVSREESANSLTTSGLREKTKTPLVQTV